MTFNLWVFCSREIVFFYGFYGLWRRICEVYTYSLVDTTFTKLVVNYTIGRCWGTSKARE